MTREELESKVGELPTLKATLATAEQAFYQAFQDAVPLYLKRAELVSAIASAESAKAELASLPVDAPAPVAEVPAEVSATVTPAAPDVSPTPVVVTPPQPAAISAKVTA